jgi:hypothetical protein
VQSVDHSVQVRDSRRHRIGGIGVEVKECCHGTIVYRTCVRVKSNFEDVDNKRKRSKTATTTVERSDPDSESGAREQHGEHREQQPPLPDNIVGRPMSGFETLAGARSSTIGEGRSLLNHRGWLD